MYAPVLQLRNAEVDFREEKGSDATHASTTAPDARLHKKPSGTGAMLCLIGHTQMLNCSDLVVQAAFTRAGGHAECRAALAMIHAQSSASTGQPPLEADKCYDSTEFIRELRLACVTPHDVQKPHHPSLDGRTTRPERYVLAQKHRKRIEEPCGWGKTVSGLAQTVHRGTERIRSRIIPTKAVNNFACFVAAIPAMKKNVLWTKSDFIVTQTGLTPLAAWNSATTE